MLSFSSYDLQRLVGALHTSHHDNGSVYFVPMVLAYGVWVYRIFRGKCRRRGHGIGRDILKETGKSETDLVFFCSLFFLVFLLL